MIVPVTLPDSGIELVPHQNFTVIYTLRLLSFLPGYCSPDLLRTEGEVQYIPEYGNLSGKVLCISAPDQLSSSTLGVKFHCSGQEVSRLNPGGICRTHGLMNSRTPGLLDSWTPICGWQGMCPTCLQSNRKQNNPKLAISRFNVKVVYLRQD